MNHPYDELYLTQVVETQGKFFEKLQDVEPRIDSEKLIEAYMRSDLRRQLDEGHAFFLTLSSSSDAFSTRDTNPSLVSPCRALCRIGLGASMPMPNGI